MRDVLRVDRVGVQAVFQDAGRRGLARLGIPPSGPFDRTSWTAAVTGAQDGEPLQDIAAAHHPAASATAVEILLGAVVVTGLETITLCIAGAPAPVVVEGTEGERGVVYGEPFELGAGEELRIGRCTAGLRIYLAIQGGFAAEPVLGSTSYDTASKLGPPPLRRGQILRAHPEDRMPSPLPNVTVSPDRSTWRQVSELTANAGPDAGLILPDKTQFEAVNWVVQPDSNRIGVRLSAPDFEAGRTAASQPSTPTKPGSIQLLPSSDLVVFGPDCPTTGGYPVVGVLDQPDLDALAQARPGSSVTIKLMVDDTSNRRS